VPKKKLIVFVKAPREGEVKTRLAATAGTRKACAVYRELVGAVLRRMGALKLVELRFTPDDSGAEIQPWLQAGWTARPQGEGDLGVRMIRAFEDSFAEGARRVVIIGSDCPSAGSADIRTAWNELSAHDVVLGPAIDGGYWLIGLRAAQASLFEGIAWSGDQVLGQTLQRARTLGLRIQLLRILADIDTEEDWNAYVQDRERS
jgi:rSAM/selenodomain-associated transferase 1